MSSQNKFNLMSLDDTQRKKVAAWIADGMKLSEIQNRLASELDVRMTYMDVRLLVDDLKLMPKDIDPPKPIVPVTPPAETPVRMAPVRAEVNDPTERDAARAIVAAAVEAVHAAAHVHAAHVGAAAAETTAVPEGRRAGGRERKAAE